MPLNLSGTNKVIEESLDKRLFSFLGKREKVFREKTIDEYKSDLYIADTDTIIEVKSILSFNKAAIFPTVFSERANRQLEDLIKLLSDGHKVCYMFASMCSGVEQIHINELQDEYYRLFKDCVNRGMIVSGVSLGMKGIETYVKKRIEVTL